MHDVDAMLKEYEALVLDWSLRHSYELSEHALEISAKLLAHRDKALTYPPGSFIQAILNNDLMGVMGSMGPTLRPYFFTIYRAFYNIDSFHIKHKYEHLSKEKMIGGNV